MSEAGDTAEDAGSMGVRAHRVRRRAERGAVMRGPCLLLLSLAAVACVSAGQSKATSYEARRGVECHSVTTCQRLLREIDRDLAVTPTRDAAPLQRVRDEVQRQLEVYEEAARPKAAHQRGEEERGSRRERERRAREARETAAARRAEAEEGRRSRDRDEAHQAALVAWQSKEWEGCADRWNHDGCTRSDVWGRAGATWRLVCRAASLTRARGGAVGAGALVGGVKMG